MGLDILGLIPKDSVNLKYEIQFASFLLTVTHIVKQF